LVPGGKVEALGCDNSLVLLGGSSELVSLSSQLILSLEM